MGNPHWLELWKMLVCAKVCKCGSCADKCLLFNMINYPCLEEMACNGSLGFGKEGYTRFRVTTNDEERAVITILMSFSSPGLLCFPDGRDTLLSSSKLSSRGASTRNILPTLVIPASVLFAPRFYIADFMHQSVEVLKVKMIPNVSSHAAPRS